MVGKDGNGEEEWHTGMSVEGMGLSTRASRALLASGVPTLSMLLKVSESELAGMRNMGRCSLAEVKSALEGHGLHLRDAEERPDRREGRRKTR